MLPQIKRNNNYFWFQLNAQLKEADAKVKTLEAAAAETPKAEEAKADQKKDEEAKTEEIGNVANPPEATGDDLDWH